MDDQRKSHLLVVSDPVDDGTVLADEDDPADHQDQAQLTEGGVVLQ